MTETPRDPRIAAVCAALGLDDIRTIADPVERDRAARTLNDQVLPAAVAEVKRVRQGAAQELRDQGLKLREIGERLDGLSTARVDQLLKGK
ncbi:hypothetical protein [Streptomyces sp. NPDC051162]|uniref:hypothetical protein n=1 Tax=Streptomyces sp. NPDC051162 TaxID=3154747 RepID=UPI0034467B01